MNLIWYKLLGGGPGKTFKSHRDKSAIRSPNFYYKNKLYMYVSVLD